MKSAFTAKYNIDVVSREERDRAWEHAYEIYAERDLLVAVLARLWPSHMMYHTHSVKSRIVVCLHSPVGKLTWSVPDEKLDWYREHVEFGENDFDGCRTSAKRARLETFLRQPSRFPADARPL